MYNKDITFHSWVGEYFTTFLVTGHSVEVGLALPRLVLSSWFGMVYSEYLNKVISFDSGVGEYFTTFFGTGSDVTLAQYVTWYDDPLGIC